MVRTGAVAIETYAEGDGPTLLILPSCGRDGGADHEDVTTRAVRAGWHPAMIRMQHEAALAVPLSSHWAC